MSLYTEVTTFETDTLRVHNVPDEVTEEKMRSEFKGDPAVLLGQVPRSFAHYFHELNSYLVPLWQQAAVLHKIP